MGDLQETGKRLKNLSIISQKLHQAAKAAAQTKQGALLCQQR
jgi:hypothetical protein